MGKVAYTIEGAATAVSLSEHALKLAIAERQLTARRIDGATLVLHTDLHKWVETFPTI